MQRSEDRRHNLWYNVGASIGSSVIAVPVAAVVRTGGKHKRSRADLSAGKVIPSTGRLFWCELEISSVSVRLFLVLLGTTAGTLYYSRRIDRQR
jgi:hypothetical protein